MHIGNTVLSNVRSVFKFLGKDVLVNYVPLGYGREVLSHIHSIIINNVPMNTPKYFL